MISSVVDSLVESRAVAGEAEGEKRARGDPLATLETEDSVEAFEAIVARYQGRVHRLVSGVLGPEFAADADDATQEIFLLAYRKLRSFRAESQFATWLYRLARNRAIDYRRHLIRMSALAPAIDWDPATVLSHTPTPFRSTERNERSRMLSAHLAKLKEPQRTAIHLHYWLGCSIEEIAELTRRKQATVKSDLFRARKLLARLLTETES